MAICIHCMSICPFRSSRIRGELVMTVCDLSSTQKASVHCTVATPPHPSSPSSIIWVSFALSLSCVSISNAGGRVSSPAYYLSLNRSGLEVVLANSRAGGSHTIMCRHVHVRCWDSGFGSCNLPSYLCSIHYLTPSHV